MDEAVKALGFLGQHGVHALEVVRRVALQHLCQREGLRQPRRDLVDAPNLLSQVARFSGGTGPGCSSQHSCQQAAPLLPTTDQQADLIQPEELWRVNIRDALLYVAQELILRRRNQQLRRNLVLLIHVAAQLAQIFLIVRIY